MSWTGRTEPTAPTWTKRLGYSYLTDVSGNYICTNAGDRILILVPGGNTDDSNFTGRTKPTNTWTKITRP